MLPIPSNKNQEGCNPISSNCVIWQGPDLPCIQLCKGDSISDVTAKLATELCDLLGQLSTENGNFNLDCFDLTCTNINNIHDLIQFIGYKDPSEEDEYSYKFRALSFRILKRTSIRYYYSCIDTLNDYLKAN